MTLRTSKLTKLGGTLALIGGGLIGSAGIVEAETTPASSGAETTSSDPASQNRLAGTSWELVATIDDGEITGDLPAAASVSFGPHGRFGVEAGCNAGGGSVQVDDESFVVSDVVLTMMACSPPVMDLEDHVLSVLRHGHVPYRAVGNLLLVGDGGDLLLYVAAE